jgi:signal transduction histidine kinase
MSSALSPPVYCLLVDDRQQNLVALQMLLQREGLTLLTAQSGLAALELLLKHDVALALIDVQMPGMDGFELAELMRGSERTRRVPIIFLTAGGDDQQRRFRGYEAGAVDFLHKPIESDILKSKADVFFELYRQRQEVARQRDELALVIEENKRLLEATRQAAAALQEIDRRKDEFLATLAHELRNPMAPILSSVQLLRRSSNVQPEVAEVYQMIERQVNHLVRLVDDLLEVSRITSGKIQLQVEAMDLSDAVHSAIEISRPLLQSGEHEFSVTLPAEPVIVQGDSVRLTQVVANLLNNAAKYTPQRGRVRLSLEVQDRWAQIRVQDSGLGIPVEMLGSVFEMFTQINRHLQRSQGGLGIGLTLVKRLVELHDGTVEVSSKGEGQGAEFTVCLPIFLAPPEPEVPADRHQETTRKNYRILLIDDNIDGLKMLSMLLSTYGHDVATAQSGQRGIEQVADFSPNLILLDIGMPGMDGYETARRLRALPQGDQLVLVALTGWGQEEDRRRTREAGFDFHLVKPLDIEDIQLLFSEVESAR